MEPKSKDTKKGSYFTFPLKFLWFDDPAEKYETLQSIVEWSIYEFMLTGQVGNGMGGAALKRASEKLDIRHTQHVDNYRETWRRLFQRKLPGDVYTSVKTSYVFDARDGKLQIELLLMIAALKSIIGNRRNFAKTTRNYIVERMYGGCKQVTRYQFDKLKDAAVAKRMFTIIPARKGYFISIRYSPTELKEIVIQRVTKYQDKKKEVTQASQEIITLQQKYRTTKKKVKTFSIIIRESQIFPN